MDHDSFVQQAWSDHAADPAAVADRLSTRALQSLSADAQIEPLANLAQHVWGHHLGRWSGGSAFLQRLLGHPVCADAGRAAVQCGLASLAVSAGASVDDTAAVTASDRVRVLATAAGDVVLHDGARAAALLRQALDDANACTTGPADPLHRALAVNGNNMARTLEDKAGRTPQDAALMLLAAETARRHWAHAGTWLEVERAEYRLAMSCLQAGDAARARRHAQACLDGVTAHGGPALERFFAHEALALTEQALARQAFDALSPDDQAWCRPTLQRLGPAAP